MKKYIILALLPMTLSAAGPEEFPCPAPQTITVSLSQYDRDFIEKSLADAKKRPHSCGYAALAGMAASEIFHRTGTPKNILLPLAVSLNGALFGYTLCSAVNG